MKKLLAGLTVPLIASITGCFAVHAFDPAAPATQAGRRRRSFSQIFNGAMSVLSHGAA
jgi:hypothetical protein